MIFTKKVDFIEVFWYNMRVKERSLGNLTKAQLIELLLKAERERDDALAELRAAREELERKCLELEAQRERRSIERARLFGRKREDGNVVNEAESSAAPPRDKGRGRGRKPGSPSYDRAWCEANYDEVRHEYPEGVDPDDPKGLRPAGEDVVYEFGWVPGRLWVTKVVKHKYADRAAGTMLSPISSNPLGKSPIKPSLAAAIMANKYLLGIPYYRQERCNLLKGPAISRQTMAEMQIRCTGILRPVWELLKGEVRSSGVAYADETPLRVVRSPKSRCYVWVYCTGSYSNPAYVYDFRDGRGSENPQGFLKGFEGFLVSDAWGAYGRVHGVVNCYCWAHARRKFYDIVKALPADAIPKSAAAETVRMIDRLFRWERIFRELRFGPERIKKARNSRGYASMLLGIKAYLESFDSTEGSAMWKAKQYVLKRWDGFTAYLGDGRVEMSNNVSERAVKPFVIDRKNFLFSFTENGAESSAMYFSLQQTARANGLDPEKYVAKCIELAVSMDPGKDDYSPLLPWNLCKEYDLK